MFCSSKGPGKYKYWFPVFLRKMSRKGSAPTRVVRFYEDFIVVIFVINRIAEKVSDSISLAQITETISPATVTFIAK